ncbi:MAG: hypothetical protein PHX25_03640 [Candidatus Pacebacteria bacterium]|nr:hypothetical protein [Candidatus Paceibacterota bacterium]
MNILNDESLKNNKFSKKILWSTGLILAVVTIIFSPFIISKFGLCVGIDSDSCYVEKALDQESVNICNKILSEDGRDWCIDLVSTELAIKNQDISFCLEMKNNEDCLSEIAYMKGDKSLCEKATYGGLKCRYEADLGKAINQAIDSKNGKFCEELSFYEDKSECYGKLGVALNDPSFCELADERFMNEGNKDHEGWNRPTCYYELALINVDIGYCNKIMNFGNWGELCVKDINSILEYVDRCLQLNDTNKNTCTSMIAKIFNETKGYRIGLSGYTKGESKNYENRCKSFSNSMYIVSWCESIIEEIMNKNE